MLVCRTSIATRSRVGSRLHLLRYPGCTKPATELFPLKLYFLSLEFKENQTVVSTLTL